MSFNINFPPQSPSAIQPVFISWINPLSQPQPINSLQIKQEDELNIISEIIPENSAQELPPAQQLPEIQESQSKKFVKILPKTSNSWKAQRAKEEYLIKIPKRKYTKKQQNPSVELVSDPVEKKVEEPKAVEVATVTRTGHIVTKDGRIFARKLTKQSEEVQVMTRDVELPVTSQDLTVVRNISEEVFKHVVKEEEVEESAIKIIKEEPMDYDEETEEEIDPEIIKVGNVNFIKTITPSGAIKLITVPSGYSPAQPVPPLMPVNQFDPTSGIITSTKSVSIPINVQKMGTKVNHETRNDDSDDEDRLVIKEEPEEHIVDVLEAPECNVPKVLTYHPHPPGTTIKFAKISSKRLCPSSSSEDLMENSSKKLKVDSKFPKIEENVLNSEKFRRILPKISPKAEADRKNSLAPEKDQELGQNLKKYLKNSLNPETDQKTGPNPEKDLKFGQNPAVSQHLSLELSEDDKMNEKVYKNQKPGPKSSKYQGPGLNVPKKQESGPIVPRNQKVRPNIDQGLKNDKNLVENQKSTSEYQESDESASRNQRPGPKSSKNQEAGPKLSKNQKSGEKSSNSPIPGPKSQKSPKPGQKTPNSQKPGPKSSKTDKSVSNMVQINKIDPKIVKMEKLDESPQTSHKPDQSLQKLQNRPQSSRSSISRRSSSTSSDGSSHPFRCTICPDTFKRKIDMIHHTKSHDEAKHECLHCGMKFKFEGYFFKHKCIECEICGQTFVLKQLLRNHQRTVHSFQFDHYQCDFCGKLFKHRHGLLYHMSKYHIDMEEKYECDICGKRAKLKETLRLHIKNHESKMVECEICHKSIKQVNLYVHMRFVHATGRNFKCPYCEQCFKTKDSLKSHVRTHEKNFECEKCGKRFTTNPHLLEHMEWHESPENFKCGICNKIYSQKYNLKVHMKLHDDGLIVEKRFKCRHCETYATDEEEKLRKHEAKHERAEENKELKKNWPECDKCKMRLKNKLKLASHYWKKHGELAPK